MAHFPARPTTFAPALCLLAIAATAGCSVKKFAIDKLGDSLANSGTTYAADDDLDLVGQALPFSLKLVEGLLAESPEHRGLLFTAASGFTQYAYVYVQQDAEMLEKQDFEKSNALRTRARRLYLRARGYGLRGLDAALEGVKGTTAIHICFGYAAIIHVRPSCYSFLPELATSPVQQTSIETAQSNLDCSILEKLPGKTIILGTLDLSDMAIETPETVAARVRHALPHVPAERIVVAPDCGLKYLPRDIAYGKMRAMVEGAKIVRQELGSK